jgi:hypothetical protein
VFIYKNVGFEIKYLHTEYDDILLNGKTIEIIDINGIDILNKINFIEFINDCKIKFIIYKIPSNDLLLKKKLSEIGFYYVTSTMQLFEFNLFDKSYTNNSNLSICDDNREQNFLIIKKLMLENFNHGKFYEDFNLYYLSNERQELILHNLYNDILNNFVVIRNESNTPLGYFIHKKELKYQELIFAGINKEIFELGLGDKIWNKFHFYLKSNLIEKTHTSISMSNIGVLNIYSKLGYTFKNIKEHYHYII